MQYREVINNLNIKISGPLIFSPKIFLDERGYFFESWKKCLMKKILKLEKDFVQENQSMSEIGVLRGLHYQIPPKSQGKLVRVVKGAIYDVIVDLRRGSTTYSQWFGIELNEINNFQLWVPEGFAHGFITIKNKSIVQYKVTDEWSKKHERTLIWDDPLVNIKWPILEEIYESPKISKKDRDGKTLEELKNNNDIFL